MQSYTIRFPVKQGKNLAIADAMAGLINTGLNAAAIYECRSAGRYTHELVIERLGDAINLDAATYIAEQLHKFDKPIRIEYLQLVEE